MHDDQQPSSPAPAPGDFNYLIVSDLHLRGGFNNPTEGLYHFDQEFADFLRYYRLHPNAGRRWRLIIAGDFIEFLYITDIPDTADPLLRGCAFEPSEYRYGAGTGAQKSRWKLDRILRSSHPQILLALARFVAEGNEILVLRGNHDIEMSWPEVQEHFRRLIAEHHPIDVGYLTMKELVRERVQFPLWFWYASGLLYVEHGCQYDPFCATEHMLYPVVPHAPSRIQLSIAELGIRYFTNQMKMIDAMAAENIMSVSEYVGWLLHGKTSVLPRVLTLYAGMVRRILAKSGTPDAEAERAVRDEHQRRVAGVDARFGLRPGTAAAVDALHAAPVTRSWIATARFLSLDIMIAAVALLVAASVIVIAYPTRLGLLVLVAATAVFGVIAYAGALRLRHVTEAAQLRHTAERLAQLFEVPYVALGHSHAAGLWRLPSGATYVNVGTWVPGGQEGFFVYFAVIPSAGDVQARLWRWNKGRGEPEPFEAA